MTTVDPGSVGDYPADLYDTNRRATYVDTLADITGTDIEHFRREGYLAVRQVVDADRIASAMAGLASVLADPGQAMVEYELWAEDRADDAERIDLVRKFMGFTARDGRLAALAGDPELIGVVRRLTGADEVALFQDMALLKPPGGGREKPWHQDNAYFAYEPGTPIVGVWIALDEATIANGCMHVIPGSHRAGPVVHFSRRDWQVCDTDVDRRRITAVPLRPGGALLFDGLLQHGTPANRTASRRRALQFHYLPAGTPGVGEARRLEVFGSEGKNVTC